MFRRSSLEQSASRWNFPQIEARRYRKALIQAHRKLESSGQLILGPGVKDFEAAFSRWLGHDIKPEQVIGVGNGTDALELALHSCGVRAGDQVALPSHTAYATAAAVLRLGAEPCFVDIAETSATLCPNALNDALKRAGTRLKAVIAVHLYGEACDLAPLVDVCQRWEIPLIEDCAQACGTTYRGRAVGTWGDRACFSFYPTKNLAACGDGGVLVVRDTTRIVEECRRSRFYGWNEQREAVQWGVNSRLDELQALILTAKLKDLGERIQQRRQVAAWYHKQLMPLIGNGLLLKLPSDHRDWRHSYHIYVVHVRSSHRAALIQAAKIQGIPLGIHYSVPCHRHPYLQGRLDGHEPLECTEERVTSILSLPLHPYVTQNMVREVCSFISKHWEKVNQ